MISGCPIRLTDISFTRKYIDTFLSFNSVIGSDTKDVLKYEWSSKENNASRFYNRNKFYQKNEEYDNAKYETDDECMPRYQLMRVKHAETFSTVYLLQVIFAKIQICIITRNIKRACPIYKLYSLLYTTSILFSLQISLS